MLMQEGREKEMDGGRQGGEAGKGRGRVRGRKGYIILMSDAAVQHTLLSGRTISNDAWRRLTSSMQGVLTFLYSGEVTLRDSTAEEVLLAADRCEVLALVNLCCSYLLDRITWRNCLHYWSLGEAVGCENMKGKSRQTALKYFDELHGKLSLLALLSSHLSFFSSSNIIRPFFLTG